MQCPMATSHGIRSASVSGSPRSIFSTFAAGCSRSPSVNGQPSRPATSAPTVDFPDPDTPATITITVPGLRPISRLQPKGRVAIRNQDERIRQHPVVPADHAFDEVEQAARVNAGEQDREPDEDDHEEGGDVEEEEHDVVRDS